MEGESCTVFIGNLSWITNSEQLFAFLSQIGPVVLVAEVRRYEDTNRSKGWGLARFVNADAALFAVKTLNGCEFHGRRVHLRLDRGNVAHSAQSVGHVSAFVGNLAWSVSEEDLHALFARWHPVNCHVLTNMYGRSRGFALVKFHDETSAFEAIKANNGVEIAGRRIECRFDRGPDNPDDQNKSSVFVSKLDPSISTESDLLALFHHIGPIVSISLNKLIKGRSRGWGVVKFQSPADARRAIETMNGVRLSSTGPALEIRFDRK